MRRAIAGSLALMLVIGACAGETGEAGSGQPNASAAEASPMPSRPLVIDTDMDSSDVMALPYLLTLPGRDVLANTVTGTGVAHCPPGAANARAIAQAVGSGVPTACGPIPTTGGLHPFPDAWRYPADELYGIDLPLGASRTGGGGAVQLLADVVGASDQPVEILTLGPLTNVAALLAAVPSAADRISRLVLMGGAIDAPGNVEADSEWNIWADPEAARAVFACSSARPWSTARRSTRRCRQRSGSAAEDGPKKSSTHCSSIGFGGSSAVSASGSGASAPGGMIRTRSPGTPRFASRRASALT